MDAIHYDEKTVDDVLFAVDIQLASSSWRAEDFGSNAVDHFQRRHQGSRPVEQEWELYQFTTSMIPVKRNTASTTLNENR